MFLLKMKKRNVWILFFISLIVACLSVILASKLKNKTIGVIIMATCFIISSLIFQVGLSHSFKGKMMKKDYIVKQYEGRDLDFFNDCLRKKKFNSRKLSFGTSYIKIENKIAYKVVLITDCDKYFDQSEKDKNVEPTKGLDDCIKFIGFEIFLITNEELLGKIGDFSFQGKKVFYEGFYYNEELDTITEANAIEPLEEHVNDVKKLKDILQLKEIEKTEDVSNS